MWANNTNVSPSKSISNALKQAIELKALKKENA
jgi:hypothetical protein